MAKILKFFYFYVAFIGLFTFSTFIMEESLQMLTFSQFTNAKTERWDIAKDNLDKMVKINNHLKFLNIWFLWVQPFQFVSYTDFADATDGYIESQRALILANDPGLYAGSCVVVKFYYRQVIQSSDGVTLKAGKLQYKTASLPKSNPVNITGNLIKITENLYEIKI